MRFGSGFVGFPGSFSWFFVDFWGVEGGPGAVPFEKFLSPIFDFFGLIEVSNKVICNATQMGVYKSKLVKF